ncbi:unnamed protein product [Phyllotreta striolata]|uniref:RanBP2-type domain-containing protein n=1 Tax=Phyllotreta striolata TaxID=444603 RepID=A0A9N9XT91_PHYSR|nr:unnamed protein product [Phyllotreta striolata]
MFAGNKRQSSNVRVMQLFHELKQQFPTIPDHVVTSCITTYIQSNHQETTIADILAKALADGAPAPTGRPAKQPEPPRSVAKRPDRLDIRPQPIADDRLASDKRKDVRAWLNDELSEKPPRSPSTAKRLPLKPAPVAKPDASKRETCSTPTQTTDTLMAADRPLSGLHVNVNCSVDVVRNRMAPTIEFTQPWTRRSPEPRGITSVNLTVRSPTAGGAPRVPAQSRLQITLEPARRGARPRPSSYHQEEPPRELGPARAGSLNDLDVRCAPPVILKQKARIERLRAELNAETARLAAIKREIEELERSRREYENVVDTEKKLIKDIKHLRYQCKILEIDSDAFYNNIYTGQTINEFPTPPARLRRQSRVHQTDDGPKWNCHVCTFLNHPILDKCEQCDFPRILHVSASPGDNIHIHVRPRMPRRITHSWVL